MPKIKVEIVRNVKMPKIKVELEVPDDYCDKPDNVCPMCVIDEQNAEIERLKAENACLLKACEEQFTFDTTQNKKYSIFNSVYIDELIKGV